MTKLLLPLLTLAALSMRAAEPVSPNNPADLDAKRDVASRTGFLTDTNRTFPMLFIIGDSTVHNPGPGERGWGDVIGKNFDTNKIRVENHALGGRSSRTFITQGWWQKVLDAAKPGDFVLLQIGHNDGGPLDDTNRARGTIRSLGGETKNIFNPITKQPETVHAYGWYLRQYIAAAHARGMTIIVCSPVPHCPKEDVKAGDVENSDYVRYSAAVAGAEKVPFINLNQITMSHYAGMTPQEIKEKYFTPDDNTHTSPAGAELNAQSVIEGLRRLTNCPLSNFVRAGSEIFLDANAPLASATIADNGRTLTLANGQVSLTLAKRGGQVSSIKYKCNDRWIELGNGRKALYFDVAGARVYPVADADCQIIRNGPDMVEVALAGKPAARFPFDSEMHLVLPRGQPGFYLYAVYRHGPGMAAGEIGETRFVIKGVPGTNIFTHHVVDEERKGTYPTAENVREVQDATWLLADGSYYTKYNNSAFMADHHVHGMAGHGLGIWMILPGTEYIGGGPFKQELTVHKDNTLLAMLVGGHFGSGGLQFKPDEPWDKVYGPVFVYFNHGPSIGAMWENAKQRAAEEVSNWPYRWLQREDYPLQRGVVTGCVKMTGGSSAKGAWAMLVPPNEDWTQVIKGYDFWTRVGSNGEFTIAGVRPGNYALIFTGADQFQEFRAMNLAVRPGETNLGEIKWQPVQHGAKLWQIGVADRSSGEFKGGDDCRHYENFLRYATDFPNDVTYVVGKSQARDDWNFAQWAWFNQTPCWTIRFGLTNEWKGRATLTIGFASVIPPHGRLSHLVVKVNGREVSVVQLSKSGTAGYRSGNQDSVYNVASIPFDAGLLHMGDNEITLGHAEAERFPPTNERHGVPGVVMYDAIRLEIDTNSPPLTNEPGK